MRLDDLNALDADAAARTLLRCCGSARWAAQMAAARPFASAGVMGVVADVVWSALDAADWLEAFAAHPRIGAGTGGSAKASAERQASDDWSAEEQSRVGDAAQDVRDRLARRNHEYEARFGYIFIVCATGRSAGEMLGTLEARLPNDPDTELRIAANEQRKITRLRLEKLVEGEQDTAT
jgi:2-oxo-4-hydroxy-4-carboxy-5-ureidoimidazoline decarboxylase